MYSQTSPTNSKLQAQELTDIQQEARRMLRAELATLPILDKEVCLSPGITNREVRTILIRSIFEHLEDYDGRNARITGTEIARNAGFKYIRKLGNFEAAEKIARNLGVALGINIAIPARGEEAEKFASFLRFRKTPAPSLKSDRIEFPEASLPANLRSARTKFYNDTITRLSRDRAELANCEVTDSDRARDLRYRIDHWKSRLVPNETELLPLKSPQITEEVIARFLTRCNQQDRLDSMLKDLINYLNNDDLVNENYAYTENSEDQAPNPLEDWIAEDSGFVPSERAFGFVNGQFQYPSGDEVDLAIPSLESPVVKEPSLSETSAARPRSSRVRSSSSTASPSSRRPAGEKYADDYRVHDLPGTGREKAFAKMSELKPGFSLFHGTAAEQLPENMYFTHGGFIYEIVGAAKSELLQMQRNSTSGYFQLLARYIKSVGNSDQGLPFLNTPAIDRSRSDY